MSVPHLGRVGLMGRLGRFVASDSSIYPRDTHVICRTPRGLEQGHVLCDLNAVSDRVQRPLEDQLTGQLLRRVTPDDRLILERLERYRDRAFEACQRLIAERELPGVLVDVEHLFDGESLFFYFLGNVDPELERLTEELAETYQRRVRFRKFAQSLAEGCGPDCGTGSGGCGSQGCGSCSLAGGCGSGTRTREVVDQSR